MVPKVSKKAKGEGNTRDRNENISEDDDVGQTADAPPIRHDLTPTMPAFAQGERSPPAVSDNFGAAFITLGGSACRGQHSSWFSAGQWAQPAGATCPGNTRATIRRCQTSQSGHDNRAGSGAAIGLGGQRRKIWRLHSVPWCHCHCKSKGWTRPNENAKSAVSAK